MTSRALPHNPGAMGKKIALPAAAAAAVPEKAKPRKAKGPVMSDEDDEAEEVRRGVVEQGLFLGWIAPRVLRVGEGAFGAAGGPE